MKFAAITREEMVDWLDGRPTPTGELLKKNSFKDAQSGQIFLVWEDKRDQTGFPIVAVPKDDLRDFFAFVSTYASGYRPFSAFFKVVSCEWVDQRLAKRSSTGISRNVFSKLIAVAFAEAFGQSQGKLQSLDNLSVQGVHATLSASLQSAVWRGYGEDELASITQGWTEARGLVSGGDLEIRPETILEVWRNISVGLINSKGSRSKAKRNTPAFHLRQFSEGSKDFEGWFLPIAKDVLGSRVDLERMLGAREDRVKVLPALLDAARSQKSNRQILEFVVGGLVSLVGNGSMAQVRYVESLTSDFPSSPLWFGLASALQTRSDALVASNCLGRHAARDIMQEPDLFDAPSYDISLGELLVLGEKALSNGLIRTSHAGILRVGLLGDIRATFKRVSAEARREQAARTREDSQPQGRRLEEVQYLLDRVQRLVRDVQSPSQRDLFERENSGPRKSR